VSVSTHYREAPAQRHQVRAGLVCFRCCGMATADCALCAASAPPFLCFSQDQAVHVVIWVRGHPPPSPPPRLSGGRRARRGRAHWPPAPPPRLTADRRQRRRPWRWAPRAEGDAASYAPARFSTPRGDKGGGDFDRGGAGGGGFWRLGRLQGVVAPIVGAAAAAGTCSVWHSRGHRARRSPSWAPPLRGARRRRVCGWGAPPPSGSAAGDRAGCGAWRAAVGWRGRWGGVALASAGGSGAVRYGRETAGACGRCCGGCAATPRPHGRRRRSPWQATTACRGGYGGGMSNAAPSTRAALGCPPRCACPGRPRRPRRTTRRPPPRWATHLAAVAGAPVPTGEHLPPGPLAVTTYARSGTGAPTPPPSTWSPRCPSARDGASSPPPASAGGGRHVHHRPVAARPPPRAPRRRPSCAAVAADAAPVTDANGAAADAAAVLVAGRGGAR